MADTDLVFKSPASGVTTDLVFGGDGNEPVIIDTVVTVAATLAPVVAVQVGVSMPATVNATMPAMAVAVRPVYVSGASRPLVHESSGSWQAASPLHVDVRHIHNASQATHSRAGVRYRSASPQHASTEVVSQRAAPVHNAVFGRHQDAAAVRVGSVGRHQDGIRMHAARRGRYQEGIRTQTSDLVRFQDCLRDRRNRTAVRWQESMPQSTAYTGSARNGLPVHSVRTGRYQEARKPTMGIGTPPVDPPTDVCYTPSGHLVFEALWDGSPALVFLCDAHGVDPEPPPPATVVVPIKRVYVVLNETSLRRVDGNVPLPTLSMSLSLDVDSWTWSFSAALPGSALANLEPASPGEPVLVEAMINGVAYRFQVEKRGRDRAFGTSSIRIGGRGLSALLDSPYAPILNHTNTEARTAQQLMNDVLTLNGASIGWTVDWQAVDWSIPAGLFAHQGTYISALNAIANAAGSYIQPHRIDQTLHVLPRYPSLPWTWSSVTPDFEIPSSVATVEGIEWVDKALYNRVFVSGIRDGVLGQVTRTGTDGGLVAPMVTDALITTAAAARQRGTPVLANTGSQAQVSLRMPVLAETGVIVPGKFVRYTDGATVHRGLVRSLQVEVGSPEVWQTIVLETHV